MPRTRNRSDANHWKSPRNFSAFTLTKTLWTTTITQKLECTKLELTTATIVTIVLWRELQEVIRQRTVGGVHQVLRNEEEIWTNPITVRIEEEIWTNPITARKGDTIKNPILDAQIPNWKQSPLPLKALTAVLLSNEPTELRSQGVFKTKVNPNN